MIPQGNKSTAILLTVVLLASGVAGATLGGVSAETTPGETNTAEDNPAASTQDGESGTEFECAATPPGDLSDPDEDVLGWENGTWYNESIDVDQSDGVQEDEQQAIVTRTTARVEAVRCIEFNESVPVSVISREEFQQQYSEQNYSEAFRAFDNSKFEALFLINESADSLEVQQANRGVSTLGFYDPRSDEIVVIAESAAQLRIDEVTLAHELVHAWQDQQFNISDDPFDVRIRDDANAIAGLIEGDASLMDTLYERQCGQAWDCLQRESDSSGELANIGVYVLKFLPYSDGPVFVQSVKREGGWKAVNELYEDPPTSSEQVIRPDKYESDPPTDVSFEDTATEEWERVRPPNRPDYASVGESALMSMFVYPLYDSEGRTQIVSPNQWLNRTESGNISDFDPFNYESRYSAGWDGDRLHVYRNESGELAYVWKLAWDSERDAEEFVEGYEQVLRYWGGERVEENVWRIEQGGFADAFYVEIDGQNVTIVNAPTVGQLTEVRPEVGPISAANATTETTDETNESPDQTTTKSAEQTTKTASEASDATNETTTTTA
jgi:hypothetical protein